MSDSAREILLIHIEETHLVHKFQITINNEPVECYKLPEEGLHGQSTAYVSSKEKATLMLRLNIDNIGAKLDILDRKIQSSQEEARTMARLHRREVALYLLRQKRLFQGYWEKFAILKYQLESQIYKLEILEANDNLVQAFKLAEAAHKSIKTDLRDVEGVLENMQLRAEEQEQIDSMVQEHVRMGDEEVSCPCLIPLL
jgi:hypothetical protein